MLRITPKELDANELKEGTTSMAHFTHIMISVELWNPTGLLAGLSLDPALSKTPPIIGDGFLVPK